MVAEQRDGICGRCALFLREEYGDEAAAAERDHHRTAATSD